LSLKHDNYIKDRKNVTIFLGEEIKMRVFLARLAPPRLAPRSQTQPIETRGNNTRTEQGVTVVASNSIELRGIPNRSLTPAVALGVDELQETATEPPQEQEGTFELYKKAAEQGIAEAQYELGKMYYDGEGTVQNYNVAFKWFEKAAKKGHVDAQFNVGLMCYDGKGIHKNYTKAFEWFKKSADQGLAKAQYNLGAIYYKGEGTTKNYKKAFEWTKKAANQGHAPAQYNLGIMYYIGKGTTKNDQKAIKWFTNAVEQRMERNPIKIHVEYA